MVSELSAALEILGLGFWLLTVLNDVSQCLINSYKVDDVATLDHSVFTGLALHLLGSVSIQMDLDVFTRMELIGWRRYFPKLFLLKVYPRTLVQPGTQKPPLASLFSLKQHKAAYQL